MRVRRTRISPLIDSVLREPPQDWAKRRYLGETNLKHRDMKTLTRIPTLFYRAQHVTVAPLRKLVGQWQCGPETISGYAQRKLRLSFTFASAPAHG